VARFQEYDQMVLTSGQPVRHEETTSTNDGVRTYLSTTFPIYDGQGHVSSVGTIYTDITERKRAEEVLQRQNEYLEALYTTTVGMVSRLDITDLLTDIIKRACTLVDADQGHIFMLDSEANEMRLEVGIGISEHLRGYRIEPGHGLIGKVWQQNQPVASDHYFLWSRRIQDVSPSLLHPVVGVPLQSGERVIGVLSMSHWKTRRTFQQSEIDLLERFAQLAAVAIDNAHLYSEAQAARAAAETANQAKSTFLANMSHELRTPLNAVLGFAQIMQRDPALSSEQREYLGIIRRSGSHLLGLINDVLEVSKIEAGRVTLHNAPFDLYEMLRGVEEMFRLRAESRRLALQFDTAPNTPRYLCGDESKLRQVLINLLGNAVKFTHEGGVTLRVRVGELNNPPAAPSADPARDLASDPAPHNGNGSEQPADTYDPPTNQCYDTEAVRLVFAVEDTGVGIAEHELSLLFQTFGQTESGHKAEEGTGLGLVISRQFVNLMQGDIVVTSRIGEGTTFTFDVVLALTDATEVQPDLETRDVVGLSLPEGQEPPRILVVDDRWENRQLLVDWLHPLGFQVREATNGREAIEVWDAWQPHLIWMDMRMPVLNGYEATKHIKAHPQGQATVIIALTASAFEHEQQEIIAVGCDDFVHKPISEATVFAKLGQHLEVEFVYAEQQDEPPPTTRAEHLRTRPDEILPLLQATLPLLPHDWRATFAQAVDELDTGMAQAAIKQLHDYNHELAQSLTHLLNSYRFDVLEELLQGSAPAEPIE
jgi:signal transduction histidine kinase/CheY-like chemotaxis protein